MLSRDRAGAGMPGAAEEGQHEQGADHDLGSEPENEGPAETPDPSTTRKKRGRRTSPSPNGGSVTGSKPCLRARGTITTHRTGSSTKPMSSPHSQPIKAPSTNIASAHVERFASGEATPGRRVTLAQESLSPTTVTPRTTAAGITTPARYPPANTAQTRKPASARKRQRTDISRNAERDIASHCHSKRDLRGDGRAAGQHPQMYLARGARGTR